MHEKRVEKRISQVTVEQLDMLYISGDLHENLWSILRAEMLDSPEPKPVYNNMPKHSFTLHRTSKA